jgi:hypothetical protein
MSDPHLVNLKIVKAAQVNKETNKGVIWGGIENDKINREKII